MGEDSSRGKWVQVLAVPRTSCQQVLKPQLEEAESKLNSCDSGQLFSWRREGKGYRKDVFHFLAVGNDFTVYQVLFLTS